MKRYVYGVVAIAVLSGCAGTQTEVKRLSPVFSGSRVPTQCQIITVLKDSPAEKAGLQIGDILKSVNGKIPTDAAAVSAIVSTAPQDSDFEVVKKNGASQHVKVHLNPTRPRLGTVCDLAGLEKPGVTVAGNESVTVFSGPYAMTTS